MFVSLNKKILYTISIFLILTFAIFLLTFFTVYGRKFMEEQKFSAISALQLSELSYKNIVLEQELNNIIRKGYQGEISEKSKKILENSQVASVNEISKEYQRLQILMQNYKKRYSSMEEAIKIVIMSALTLLIMIVGLAILIRNWMLIPIKRLSKVSDKVAAGDLSSRVAMPKKRLFKDEFSNLNATFNQMLENLQQSFEEIKNKEYFLQSLIDNIPDGIRVIDENYNIIIANKTYYRQVNKENKEILEKCYQSSHNLDHPCSFGGYHCPVRELKDKKKSFLKVVQSFGGENNYHYSINAAPMKINHNGKNNNYIVEAIRDLSSDIEFSHQQKLSSFSFLGTSIAHEIKNHLGAIQLICEALLEQKNGRLSVKENEYLELINRQIKECINVPERLLSLTREANADDTLINCEEAIKEMIYLLDYEAKRNGISIDFISDEKPVYLCGNASDFKMIVINLIQNAIKAMPDGGNLKIVLKQTKQKIKLLFEDSGCGIAHKDIQRIFEPFYSTSQGLGASGTGLGLPIVKSIVGKLCGKIKVKSKLGKGSEFMLEFDVEKKKTDK